MKNKLLEYFFYRNFILKLPYFMILYLLYKIIPFILD
jgi:hypothetical protein